MQHQVPRPLPQRRLKIMTKYYYVGKGFWKQCCARDEGVLALRCRPAGEGTRPPCAALAEDRCGERYGKRRPGRVSGGDQGDGAQPQPWVGVAVDVSLFKSGDIESGRSCACVRSLAGARVLARRCPAWRRREAGLRPLHGTWEGVPRYASPGRWGRGSGPSSVTCEGLSTDAAGTPADRFVVAVNLLLGAVGVERRGRVIRGFVRWSTGVPGRSPWAS